MSLLWALSGGVWNSIFGSGLTPLIGQATSTIGTANLYASSFWDRKVGGRQGIGYEHVGVHTTGNQVMEMPHYLGGPFGFAFGDNFKGAYPSIWSYRKAGRGFVAMAGDLYWEIPFNGSKNREASPIMRMQPAGPRVSDTPFGPPGPCEVQLAFQAKTGATTFPAVATTEVRRASLYDPTRNWTPDQWKGQFVYMSYVISSTTYEMSMRITGNSSNELFGTINDVEVPSNLGGGAPANGKAATDEAVAWVGSGTPFALPGAQGGAYTIYAAQPFRFELCQNFLGQDWGPQNQAFVSAGQTRFAYDGPGGLGIYNPPVHLELICYPQQRATQDRNSVHLSPPWSFPLLDRRAQNWKYELWVDGVLDCIFDGFTQVTPPLFGTDLGYPWGFGIGMVDYGSSSGGKGGGGSTGTLSGRVAMFNMFGWDDLDGELPNTAPLYTAPIPPFEQRIQVVMRRTRRDGLEESVSADGNERGQAVTGSTAINNMGSYAGAGGAYPNPDIGQAMYTGRYVIDNGMNGVVNLWNKNDQDCGWHNGLSGNPRSQGSEGIVWRGKGLGVPMEPLEQMDQPVFPNDLIIGVHSWAALGGPNNAGNGVPWMLGELRHCLAPEMLEDVAGSCGCNASGMYNATSTAPDGQPWNWDKLSRSQLLIRVPPQPNEYGNPAFPNDKIGGPYPPDGWMARPPLGLYTTANRIFYGAGQFIVFIPGAETNPGSAGEKSRRVRLVA